VLVVCAAVYAYAVARGLSGDKRVSFYGPLVMLRCERCVGLIKHLSRLRAPLLSLLAIASWIAGMAAGMLLLFSSAISSFLIPPEEALPAQAVIALPGLNPFIPLTYGALALALAVAIHELAHGAALAANGLTVKSAGVLLLGIPLGAFVEPGDDFRRAGYTTKLKVYASGPFANFAIALLSLLLIALATSEMRAVAQGMGVIHVEPGTPAERAGLKPGDIIVAIEGTRVNDAETFRGLLAGSRPGTVVTLELADGRRVSVVLGSRPDNRSQGFLGVVAVPVGGLSELLPTSNNLVEDLRALLALPFGYQTLAYLPMFYTEPVGGWETLFALLWIGWMNMAVGLTNALPALPLDGGSAISALMERALRRWPEPRRNAVIKYVTALLSALTAILISTPIVVPRIRGLLSR